MDPISTAAADVSTPAKTRAMTGSEARGLRESLGISQAWVMAATGVNNRSLTRWENSDAQMKTQIVELLLDVEQRTDHAIGVVISDYQAAVRSGPLTTYRTDDSYHGHTDGAYTALWHRTAAYAIAKATGCGTLYADTTSPPPAVEARADGQFLDPRELVRDGLLLLSTLPGGNGQWALAATKSHVPLQGLVKRYLMTKQNTAAHRDTLSAEEAEIVRAADYAIYALEREEARGGTMPDRVWIPDPVTD